MTGCDEIGRSVVLFLVVSHNLLFSVNCKTVGAKYLEAEMTEL